MVKEGETLKPERGMWVLSSLEELNEKEILGQQLPRISLMFSRIPESCCGTWGNPPEENQKYLNSVKNSGLKRKQNLSKLSVKSNGQSHLLLMSTLNNLLAYVNFNVIKTPALETKF